MRRSVVGAIVVVWLAGSAWAGTPPHKGSKDRQELAAMVDTYLLMQVQERLDLSDEQFVRAMPLVRRLQAHRREMMDGRREAIRELKSHLESGSATDKSVQPYLERLRHAERSMCQRIIEDMKALDELLTPVQQAKYRVLEAEVEKRIRRLRRRAGGHGPRFPAPETIE